MNPGTLEDLRELKRLVDICIQITEAGMCHTMTDEERAKFRQRYADAYMVIGPYSIYRIDRSRCLHLQDMGLHRD
jgi:hypothetical protein